MGAVVRTVVGGVAGLLLGKPKKPKAQAAQVPTPTRLQALDDSQKRALEELRRRRGAGAYELTGGGAEAPSGGGKTLLGQ